MRLLTIPLGVDGPVIEVGMSVPWSYSSWGGPTEAWKGLIDTGADITAISPTVVASLRPMHIGTMPVSRPGGGGAVRETYDVRLRLGGVAAPGRWSGLEAVAVQPATTGINVLIGLDVLMRIELRWHGPRKRLVLRH